MYSIPHVKSMAKAVAKAIKSQPEPLKHQQILDALSQGLGVKNFDVFSAKYKLIESDYNNINLSPTEINDFWLSVENHENVSTICLNLLKETIPLINKRFRLNLSSNDIIHHYDANTQQRILDSHEISFEVSNIKLRICTPEFEGYETLYLELNDGGNSNVYKNLPSTPTAIIDDLEYTISKTLLNNTKSLFERTQPNQRIADLMWNLYQKLKKVSPACIKPVEDGYPDEIEIKWLLYKDSYSQDLTVWIGNLGDENKFVYTVNGEGPHNISYEELSDKINLIVSNIKKFNILYSSLNKETVEVFKHKRINMPEELFELCPAFKLLKCGFEI